MVDPRAWLLALSLLVGQLGCGTFPTCSAGQQQSCTQSLEGGFVQTGTQTCDARGVWSECVSAGACTSSTAGTLPAYARCVASTQCGPASCATCNHYTGVNNPQGYSVCYPFCQADTDCAPATVTAAVAPRCILGQCTLLCHAADSCPNDAACLAWSDATTAGMFPGFDGLCE